MHTPAVEVGRRLPGNDPNSATSKENWRLWCRLCAKEDPQGNINVFFKDEQQTTAVTSANNVGATATAASGSNNNNSPIGDLTLAATIEKHFCVQIARSDELPKMLCTECFSLVTALVNFAERVSKVQQMFCTVQNICDTSKLDLHAVRLKYGLLDEEREHVLMPQALPEVHYFEDKPKVNDLEEKMFEAEPAGTLANPLEQQPRIRIKIKKENLLEEFHNLCLPNEEKELAETEQEMTEQDEGEDEDAEEQEDPFHPDDADDDDDDANFKPEQSLAAASDSCSEDEENTDLIVQRKVESIKSELAKLQPTPKKRRAVRTSKRSSDTRMTLAQVKCKLDGGTDGESDVDADTSTEMAVKKLHSVKKRKTDTSSNGNLYVCTDCPRIFKRIQHFRQHMKRTHSKLAIMPQLNCSQCPRVCSTQHQLEKHAKVHLPLELKKVLPCPYCDKKFTSNTLVQTHVKYVHMNERPFICEECGVTVRTNGSLKTHMLTHTDYAPFECEICKKRFKNQVRLKNHMETHDPNKHVCAECGLQLNSRATLNRHLLVHSDEMQHKCDYCGRAFKRAKALKNHLILHTGLKPYACDFCDRTFANGSNCRSHKKKAHPQELAALEAAGGGKIYTRNIPKLVALKAVTKAADNLAPVVSKQSGCFAFGKKPKAASKGAAAEDKSGTRGRGSKKHSLSAVAKATGSSEQAAAVTHELHAANSSNVTSQVPTIPTIDNIYSHIMKQAHMAAAAQTASDSQVLDTTNALAIHIKRPPSEASSSSVLNASCMALEQHEQLNAITHAHVDVMTAQQLLQQQQQQLQQLQQQQQQQLSQPATPTPTAEQHFYAQLVKQQHSMQTHEQQQRISATLQHHQQQQQHQQALLVNSAQHQQLHDETASMRSPDSQASLHNNATGAEDRHTNAANRQQHFYSQQIGQTNF